MKNRILITGTAGQVGWSLQQTCPTQHFELIAPNENELDITNVKHIEQAIDQYKPNFIVNAAAYTAVDKAELEKKIAMKINAEAATLLAKACHKSNVPLFHFSTDYVFDGTKGEAYNESDTPNPLNRYGKSKLEGELAVLDKSNISFILRTSWLYGDQEKSFPWKVLKWVHTQEIVRVVNDQIGSPTWNRILAEATLAVIEQIHSKGNDWAKEYSGIYHVAGEGSVSRFDWAKEIVSLDPDKQTQTLKALIAAKSDDFATQAERPRFSALDCRKLERVFEIKMPHWKDSLELAIEMDS